MIPSTPDTPRSAEEGRQRKIIERLRAAIFDDERIEPTSRLKEAYNEIAMELVRVQCATPASEPLPDFVNDEIRKATERWNRRKFSRQDQAMVCLAVEMAKLSTPTTPVPTEEHLCPKRLDGEHCGCWPEDPCCMCGLSSTPPARDA